MHYLVRLIAEQHGGTAMIANLDDGSGVQDQLPIDQLGQHRNEPDVRIARIRLSDHPRHVVPKPAQAYEPKVPVKVREWITPALLSRPAAAGAAGAPFRPNKHAAGERSRVDPAVKAATIGSSRLRVVVRKPRQLIS
jgi:hypothetical protein